MKARGGTYYPGLDHIRAIAVFLVFTWHFLHVRGGHLWPIDGTFDFFAFSILAEGHTGVSLFMILSGYLFTKVIGNNQINYINFIASRAVRLFPMLILAYTLLLFKNIVLKDYGLEDIRAYFKLLAQGFVLPVWPNGGWSITAELHFYLILPLLLLFARTRKYYLISFVIIMIIIRSYIHYIQPGVSSQDVAY